ncbi:MAG TPA: carbon-nitrogen hydrolase family protein [Candidatus Limnocylindrales bacterium]|nr:carbon-nitrogen hydrolase family protein [Candidatus Limnocylindrales bacterium]
MKSFLAAAIQLHAGTDKAANVDAACRWIEEAAGAGAELIALPEVFAWRGPLDLEHEQAEPIPGPTSDRMAELARRLRVHLVAGSILELAAGQERPFNTSVVYGPDGERLAVYRKIHLFDIDIPGRVTVRESATRARGNEIVTVATGLGRIGLAICYDLRFPELFRRLCEAGAEIVVMPSAFTRPTGQAHWEALVRARAIENQLFMIAPNQFGRSSGGIEDYGNSLLVDPWGKVLARGEDDGAGFVMARFEAEVIDRVRQELPCLEHRRLQT